MQKLLILVPENKRVKPACLSAVVTMHNPIYLLNFREWLFHDPELSHYIHWGIRIYHLMIVLGCGYVIMHSIFIDSFFSMDQSKSGWYLLQTNYDHWENPLIIDDRRTPVSSRLFLCNIELLLAVFYFPLILNILRETNAWRKWPKRYTILFNSTIWSTFPQKELFDLFW